MKKHIALAAAAVFITSLFAGFAQARPGKHNRRDHQHQHHNNNVLEGVVIGAGPYPGNSHCPEPEQTPSNGLGSCSPCTSKAIPSGSLPFYETKRPLENQKNMDGTGI